MKTKKLRRHSGWVFPQTTLKIPKKEIINECLEPTEYYSEWDNYRDGFRGYGDRTKIRNSNMCFSENFEVMKWNKKLKIKRKIREARK